jgi:hypothetical protein
MSRSNGKGGEERKDPIRTEMTIYRKKLRGSRRYNSSDSEIVGGYPGGRDWDLICDEFLTEIEARAAVKLISSLPIPARDPVTGEPMTLWRDAPRTFGVPF